MSDTLPREPHPENIPVAPIPRGPLSLTARGYLLIGAGVVIVLMMAYGSCHRPPQQPYGPRFSAAEAAKKQEEVRAEKARREYEEWMKLRHTSKAVPPEPESDPGGTAAAPQKTPRQLQAEDLEKRLHDAAYAVPLVTESRSKQSERRPDLLPSPAGASPLPAAGQTRDDRATNPGRFTTLPAGTILNAETVNMLDGSNTGPLVAMLTRDVYVPNTQRVLIPQGANLFGEASRVSSLDQDRLTIAFHRLNVTPTTFVSLDRLPGLDQEGATGLHDQVNRHYAQIFGVSMAIGALGGLAQIGNGSYGGLEGYDATTQLRNGITNSFSTSAGQVLSRFLQRMPTVKIRPGQRVDVLLTSDLKIPDVLE